ncbi:hypothetical protein [Veillonella rodentium]|uniref:Uncharacterized protein n=1 Tax=Veillonella rodentium TaxID=248315 RepID=A0A239ZM26_9FIRM|nr:hypothetical protein [Veillonella rodentium]SNV72067.1 Uncharacterised protein [Veillonella rodentium]
MNMVIYEALAKYKKDDKLPYTEYFSLGFLGTKDLAIETIISAKQLPGFRELYHENFYFEKLFLNDGIQKNSHIDDIIEDNKVFILWYGYDIDSIYTVGGTLGVFSKYEYAELAREKYSSWDIFIVHGLENLGIDKVTLNKRQWVDGFVKVYD